MKEVQNLTAVSLTVIAITRNTKLYIRKGTNCFIPVSPTFVSTVDVTP